MPDHPPVNVNIAQNEPGFTVTLREVWEEVRGVSSKLDTIHDLPGDVSRLQGQVRDIETNYVSKASVRWWFSAVAALIVAATGIIALIIQR